LNPAFSYRNAGFKALLLEWSHEFLNGYL